MTKLYGGIDLHTNDHSDARWLAQLLSLGIIPTGCVYPKEDRAIRDVLRKRSQLVRQKTSNLLSIHNLVIRNTGTSLTGNRIKTLTAEAIRDVLPTLDLALAVTSTLVVMRCVAEQIAAIEHAITARVSLRPTFRHGLTVAGIGQTLALTIMLEAGDMHRFPTVGQWASSCRCVNSTKLSNGKRKGQGNTKNGNTYGAWAFIEAVNFAVRYYPDIQRFYQRKKSKTHGVVAIKAVAHTGARACYDVLRDQLPFDIKKAFTTQPVGRLGRRLSSNWGWQNHEIGLGSRLPAVPPHGTSEAPELPQAGATKRVEPHGTHEICDRLVWTGLGTNGFLGPIIGQGRERLRLFALILMGDWCDSGYKVDTATRENSDAVNRGSWRSCGGRRWSTGERSEPEAMCAHLTGAF